MALDKKALAAAKRYVASTADSLGSLKGAPCTIKSQTETDDSYIVTFEWTGTSGAKETSQLTIKKPKDGIDGLPGKDGKDGLNGKDGQQGADGIGISKIEKIGTVDLIDTYRITFTDNSTFDYEVKNGKDGQGGGTADVPIEKIKVNGELQTPVNKVVDITVPSIEGLTKDADLATVAKSGNYNDLVDTPAIPSIEGLAKTEDIPTTLPANGGNSDTVNNHTIESDVPTDAVFTDTIYDDTEVKESIEELNSNLDTLEYSEIAGGKNLANINDFKLLTTNPSRYGYEWINMKGGTYTFNITNGNNILYIGYKHNGEFVNPSSVVNNSKVQIITISDGDDIVIWYENGVTENTVTSLQLEVGGVATEYEPYIPSIKMLNKSLNNYALKSLYSDTTINIGRLANSTVGKYSIAEGQRTTASGYSSHAEGQSTTASGDSSHAEGSRTTASGNFSHAEGDRTTASNDYSHAEGFITIASGSNSHAEGESTTASGDFSHAEGSMTTASGDFSHTEGSMTTAEGTYSHAEGNNTTASNLASHVSGKYNVAMTTGGASGNTTGTAFVIGNGTGTSALSNAFSVQYSGIVKAKSTITASTTADYAEFFEWLDKNPNEEDRVGHFVTLDGDKIKIATSEDDYILGIVSGEPFVLGNGDCDTWNGMYLHDEFRRTMYEPAPKMIEILDSKGNPTGEYEEVKGEYEGTRPILNPDYDQTKQYISRFDRAEWSPVGMLGVLAVLHDGTAEVNGYVTVNNEGIATKCTRDTRNSYRVIKKVSDKVVEVIFR